jgi:hypothetical protein
MTTTPGVFAIRTVPADLERAEHQAAVLAMVDAKSRDPMGGGAPLSTQARAAHPGIAPTSDDTRVFGV